jgi:hypothetical protein
MQFPSAKEQACCCSNFCNYLKKSRKGHNFFDCYLCPADQVYVMDQNVYWQW